MRGDGVARNDREAVKWFRKAAEHGSAAGEHQLGQAYQFGRGVTPDYQTAMRWYQAAADHGLADARRSLEALAAKLNAEAHAADSAAQSPANASEREDVPGAVPRR
jgi:TPR repeat protein